MMIQQDLGEYIIARHAFTNAAGTTAGTAVNGKAVDTRALGSHYQSAVLVVNFNYKKAANTTIAMNAHFQHGHTTTAYVTLGSTSGYAVSVAATTAGTSNFTQLKAHVDLTAARRYVRARVTPQISVVSSVNFMNYSGVILFGGADAVPAS